MVGAKMTPQERALTQPIISRAISRYLLIEECAACMAFIHNWDSSSCNLYRMTEMSRKPSKALVNLLTKEDRKLHLSLGDPSGPTYEGGACLMLYKLMSETGPCNLVRLDLSAQRISIFDHLRIYRPRPTTDDETMLPFLEKIAVNVCLDMDGSMEHYPPLAEPKRVRSMKVLLSGSFKHPQTDRFLETWDFTRKFTLTGEAPLEADEEFFRHYEDFSMPTVRYLSLPAASRIIGRSSCLRFVYPKLEKIVLTDIRDATLPIEGLAGVTSIFPGAEVVLSGKRKSVLPRNHAKICEKCGPPEDDGERQQRFRWSVGLTAAPAAYDKQSVVLLSCTIMAISAEQQLIQPLDVSLVYLQGRPAALAAEKSSGEVSSAENLLITRHDEIRHLIFEACKAGAYEHEAELVRELTTFCREKFLKLLTLCRASLTRLEVSAEFVFGCCLDAYAESQARALQGAFKGVTELAIEPDRHMEFERFQTQPIACEKLSAFLGMFPRLTSLRLCAGKWVSWSSLVLLLADYPGGSLEKLYVSCDSMEDVATALQTGGAAAHSRLRTLICDFPETAVLCDFSGLKHFQGVEYLLIRTNCMEDVDEKTLEDCFKAMPHLRWFIVVLSHAACSLVGYRAEPGRGRVELRSQAFAEPEQLAKTYPQLHSIFWTDILTN